MSSSARRIVITGAHGLIGSALHKRLAQLGIPVLPLRRGSGPESWDPERGRVDAQALEGLEAVIHLAGENIGTSRWSRAKKRRIRVSRVAGTALLAGALARLRNPPRSLLCASAVGYYGNRGQERLDDSAAGGAGFLARVCREWEGAAAAAADSGIRVLHMRFGVVLGPGAAILKAAALFRLGLGGRLGDGSQLLSWIALEDCVSAIVFLLEHGDLSGAVNVVSPRPVTNAEFTHAFAAALRRPALFAVPAPLLRLALGEAADEVLLASINAYPRRLLETGFEFRSPAIGETLEAALRSSGR